uniref:Uncharacterized protein n=1 Tax=Caenorhabditis japonica TaxID=281687 RepID=A0A8R1HHD7_CAEJA
MQSVITLGRTAPRAAIWLRAASTKGPLKEDWKKDMVYFYQFPRPGTGLPNLSPFCLKVETFLRANQINHEIVDSMRIVRNSPRGLLPFVELNGQQIADSQVIVWELQKHFQLDDKLEGADRGTARAVERMVEMSTNYALLDDKFTNNMDSFPQPKAKPVKTPSFLDRIMGKKPKKPVTPLAMVRKRVSSAFGKLSQAEQKELMRRDIRALDDILGDKKFLFGDHITSVDCSVFGQLAAVYYLPHPQQLNNLLDGDFPRVRAYCDRIRQHYYPEWKS